MSGFVSIPAAPEPAEPPIAHDGFFPGVKAADIRALQRIPAQVTPPRLADAIVTAMLAVGVELAQWKADQVTAGFATLAAVSADQVAGKPRLVALYERAIASFTAAELADTHHDISATADGKDRAEERATTADEHRRNAVHAVRDILGATRTAVELI